MRDGGGLFDRAEHIAGAYLVADCRCGHKAPFLFAVELRHFHAARNAVALGFVNFGKRPLNAVINAFNKPGRQFHAQRLAGQIDGLAGADAGGIFVNLYRGHIVAQFNDFADELLVADAHHVVHLHIAHAVGDNQRACNFPDNSGVFVFCQFGHLPLFLIK